MVNIQPKIYWTYSEDKGITDQFKDLARNEIKAGKEVEFNGRTYNDYELLIAALEAYCNEQNSLVKLSQ